MSLGATTRLRLNITRGFPSELGAVELWLRGVRYRLALARWRP